MITKTVSEILNYSTMYSYKPLAQHNRNSFFPYYNKQADFWFMCSFDTIPIEIGESLDYFFYYDDELLSENLSLGGVILSGGPTSELPTTMLHCVDHKVYTNLYASYLYTDETFVERIYPLFGNE